MAAIAGRQYTTAVAVLLDKDESCPTADPSNIRPSQWSGLFDRWAVEHAPGLVSHYDQ